MKNRGLILLVGIFGVALTVALIFSRTVETSSGATVAAKQDIWLFVVALKNYQDEYGHYPELSQTLHQPEALNARLLQILMGRDDVANPQKQVFVGIRGDKSKLLDYLARISGLKRGHDHTNYLTEAGKHGRFYYGGIDRKTGLFVDPWGMPYWIQIRGAEIEVRSAGRNFVFGDADDMVIYDPPRNAVSPGGQ